MPEILAGIIISCCSHKWIRHRLLFFIPSWLLVPVGFPALPRSFPCAKNWGANAAKPEMESFPSANPRCLLNSGMYRG